MRQLVKIVAVQVAIFVSGLIAIEYALAWFMPLLPHGGVYTERNGAPVRVSRDDLTLTPNLDIVHSASEFSASIHTNDLGYRRMAKESRTPDFLFLGDSFTFGHGVGDNETFAQVFCARRGFACLNLGRSGTQTFDQVKILRHAIDVYQVRPKAVIVAMLAACWLGVAGNDLGDNLAYARANESRTASAAKPSSPTPTVASPPGDVPSVQSALPSIGDIVKAVQQRISGFEITKRVMLIATGGVKASLYACSEHSELESAGHATGEALRQLGKLASEFGFAVDVVLIHPYQELDGAYRTTEAIVASVMPETFRCFGSAAQMNKADYFAYDGHFNAKGHAVLASVLAGIGADGRVGSRADARCRSVK